ncbi:MAG: 2-amino-4-hydroxy-6-hydroxymethyldihydropteridine diphosphokinase [Anaerolineales bacterium]|nr:2-amino-4-hydroxy-6-hydroxymethyldihydropteridine diphosphokinase [Anaerolineales bacterium]
MTSINPAFISIGSNIQPEWYLPLAVERMHEIGEMVAVSKVYQNPAIGRRRQPDFLNCAVLVGVELSAMDIRHRLREMEADLDRIRTEDKYAPRTIDLDLSILGDLVLETPEMVLPDPDILRRAYMAVTLAELDPTFPHPITSEPLQDIADRLRSTAILKAREDVAKMIQKSVRGESS